METKDLSDSGFMIKRIDESKEYSRLVTQWGKFETYKRKKTDLLSL